jgi:hypothetical protein
VDLHGAYHREIRERSDAEAEHDGRTMTDWLPTRTGWRARRALPATPSSSSDDHRTGDEPVFAVDQGHEIDARGKISRPAEFLKGFMSEFFGFITRVYTVLPRGN